MKRKSFIYVVNIVGWVKIQNVARGYIPISQLTCTCSKSTIVTIEKGVSIFKVKNENTRTTACGKVLFPQSFGRLARKPLCVASFLNSASVKERFFYLYGFKACVCYFYQISIFSRNDSPLKTMKNVFYSI